MSLRSNASAYSPSPCSSSHERITVITAIPRACLLRRRPQPQGYVVERLRTLSTSAMSPPGSSANSSASLLAWSAIPSR